MKRIGTLGAVAVLTLTTATALAQSGPTGWEMRGQVTSFYNPPTTNDIDIPIGVGSPLRAIVNFDTGTPLSAVPPSGKFQQSRADVSIVVYVGGYGPFISVPSLDPNGNPRGSITVRDRAAFPEDQASTLVDGYSFGTRTIEDGVTTNVLVIFRGDNDSLVSSANKLPFLPPNALTDPASLAALPEALIQVCRTDSNSTGDCNRGEINARFTMVNAPTFGTNWTLTARDCYAADTRTVVSSDPLPNDCIRVIGTDAQGKPISRLGFGRSVDSFAALGVDGFDRTFAPISSGWSTVTEGQSLGTVVGRVSFTGPAGLPILKGASLPTDISRTNSNLLAYQRYDYVGAETDLPLIVDLTYAIADNSVDPTASTEVGLRPGGATMGSVIAIVDAGKVSVPQVAATPFNAIECGKEGVTSTDPNQPNPLESWPVGSVLGTASFLSPGGQKNSSVATVLDVRSCGDSSKPIRLAANQNFIVASSMQTPARGKWTSAANQPTANGFVDARNTMRVTFNPSAPAAVVQNLVQNIAPACTDCGTVTAEVDVRPGNPECINPRLKGVVPAAFMGSENLDVRTIRVDSALKLGKLSPRRLETKPLCSLSDVNADGYPDLVCQFENDPTNWLPGQTKATLSGRLQSGLPIAGTDTICVK